MVTDEMVEKAARRMAVADGQNPDKLSHNSFEWWRHYVPMARAALEAAMSAAETQPAPSVAVQAIEAVWKYSLVIESSVRRGDGPEQYAGVTEALRLVKEARSALSAQVQDVATHRHKKRGTEYVLMGVGKMQAENWQVSVDGFDQSIDMQEVAVYRSVDDGSLWVRPVEEFNDGRFEPLPAAPAKQEG